MEMCTAATYKTKDFYMGRTLDYEFSYGDEIVVTPRRFPLDFCHMGKCDVHYGMIGMAHVAGEYPLYYDAVNEKGVGEIKKFSVLAMPFAKISLSSQHKSNGYE